MKNLGILLIAMLCFGVSVSAESQILNTVQGNGTIIRKVRQTPPFDGLRVSTGIDVYLKQGDNISVEVETDENLHEYINTNVKNGILHVYTDLNIRRATVKKVYISMKDITSLHSGSAGDITGETPVRTDNIEIGASSAGDIKLEVYARSVSVNISSSGDVTLKGECENLFARLSSAGNLNAFDLRAKEAEVNASSAGDADISVSKRLRARASSAGNIIYQGNPAILDSHSSSAGTIRRR
jgi:hypothetical protein